MVFAQFLDAPFARAFDGAQPGPTRAPRGEGKLGSPGLNTFQGRNRKDAASAISFFCVEATAGTLLLLAEAAATQLAVNSRLASTAKFKHASGGIGRRQRLRVRRSWRGCPQGIGWRGICQAGGCQGSHVTRKAVMLRLITACIDVNPLWAARFRIVFVNIG